MILKEDFPRATVLWILIAQCAVFLPHLLEVPIWLSVLYFACIAWRFGVYQGRWTFPGNWIKTFLIVIAFLSVLASYRSISGAKGGVALLLIAFAYKSLEMKEQRDAYLVIMLAYFVVACAFLYQRSFFAAAYLLFCAVLVTSALVSMNHLPKKNLDLEGFWLSAKMLLQAIPLMVFLFLFFPQLPPLFQVNLGNDATTGLSDTMRPGSFSNLTKSGDLVFRVSFKGEVPPSDQLYWRAQVFEDFDGIGWNISNKSASQFSKVEVLGKEAELNPFVLEYEIIQEASNQSMLFSLPTAWSDEPTVQLNTDFTLSRSRPVSSLFSYSLKSNLAYPKDKVLDDFTRQRNLELPIYGNEKAKKLALDLRSKVNSDLEYMAAVQAYFLSKPFEYTLKPPILGANPVDEFLLDSQSGFCEHYASSFVYLMRAGGVPARVLGGYLGGEYNKAGNYLLVYQFEAHAWAEVWFEDRGWVRIDPTAWIAPDRINQGIEQALPPGENILEGSLLSARKYNPLTELRLQLDYFNMRWDKWVLGYDEQAQRQLFQQILGGVSSTRITLFMAVCFSLVVLLTALSVYIKDLFRVQDPADRLYLSMQKKLKRRRWIRKIDESPNDFAARVSQKDSELGEKLAKFSDLYSNLKYSGISDSDERKILLKQMKRDLSAI